MRRTTVITVLLASAVLAACTPTPSPAPQKPKPVTTTTTLDVVCQALDCPPLP